MILHGLLRDDHPNFKRIFRTYFFEERETFTSLLDSIRNNTTIEGNAIFLIIISRFYSRMITILPRFGFAIYGLETIFYIYISIEIELAERWKSLAGLLSGLEITKNIRGRLITGVDNKWNVLLRRTRDPPKRMHRGSFEHTRVSPYLVLRSLDLLSFRPKRFHPPPPWLILIVGFSRINWYLKIRIQSNIWTVFDKGMKRWWKGLETIWLFRNYWI